MGNGLSMSLGIVIPPSNKSRYLSIKPLHTDSCLNEGSVESFSMNCSNIAYGDPRNEISVFKFRAYSSIQMTREEKVVYTKKSVYKLELRGKTIAHTIFPNTCNDISLEDLNSFPLPSEGSSNSYYQSRLIYLLLCPPSLDLRPMGHSR